MEYEVDLSELEGRTVECPPECGMCCLCQPEVLPEERGFFKANHPDRLVRAGGQFPYVALAMKKGRGSCVFLEGRRCTVYGNRPAYCRQFPFHLYAGERLQVELDLSCRGVWTGGGRPAAEEARPVLEIAERRIAKAMEESAGVYSEFYSICREAGVMADPAGLRLSASDSISMFTDPAFLGKVMEAAEFEPVMSLGAVKPDPDPDLGLLQEAGMDAAMESISSSDPMSVPVYCDRSWNWNMFMADGGRIEWNVMDDEGELHHRAFADAAEIELRFPDAAGRDVMESYLRTLNARDSFMGSVFSAMDENGYEDDMSNSYYGSLAVTAMDLLWRMSMLDHFMGTGTGAEGAREAVIFYDMDRLDAPTIGAFVRRARAIPSNKERI